MNRLIGLLQRHKTYLIVLIFTLIGHGLGFGREVTIAYLFGASSISDGILVGLAPLMWVFGVFGVGYANAAMARLKSPDNHQAIEQSMHPMLVVSVIAAILFYSFNQQVIGITAPGLKGDGLQLATELVKWSAISCGVACIYYWYRGVRYLEKSFLRVSVSELMPNIGVFIGILLLYRWYGVAGIAAGITVGYILQLAVVFDAKRINLAGFGPKTLYSEDAKIIYKNTFYAALGMSGVVVQLFVDRYFASNLAEGSVASINFANKVMTLPLYTVVFAIVTVMFPKLIELRDNLPVFNRVKIKINWMLVAFGLVCSVIFISFSAPIISLLFEYGNFDASDVAQTAPVLAVYSVGLVAQALVMFHCKVRFALEDFRTPLIAGTVAATVNFVLDYLLVDPYGIVGLAWASTVAAMINASILMLSKPPKTLLHSEPPKAADAQ